MEVFDSVLVVLAVWFFLKMHLVVWRLLTEYKG